MHFIPEEKEKELIGNIKLSSVTAENNLVFCSVACDLVRSLRWQGSSCLADKAHRCLRFYPSLRSNGFLRVLEAGRSSERGLGWDPRGRGLRWRTRWPVGGELGGRWVEAFAAVLQGVMGDQRAAGGFCWLE